MDSDDKVLPKAFGSHASYSAVSTLEENGDAHNNTKNQSLQEFLKSYPKKDLIRLSLDKVRKQFVPSKCKTATELPKAAPIKGSNNVELKKHSSNNSSSNNNQASKKQPRKGENPSRLSSAEVSVVSRCASSWTCKNSACKAVLTTEDTFCKRCSCCICHLFDDNKDPSLWLVCTSESAGGDWCGLSCHIDCALQRGKAGVVDRGQFMQLDGSYCCASCGKVSGIIGWRKQLATAKDARRIDVLCYRIFLSYRLLDGTSRFKDLQKIVEDAKAKLETEVGPLNGMSAKMARGIVSRLSIAADVQRLCSLAIEKADEWLSSNVNIDPKHSDSLPAACCFQFEEISSSSLVIVLKETCSPGSDSVKGYKIWYYKTWEEPGTNEPVTFPRAQRRILISNLQPCTEYAFRVISFTKDGDWGHSEAKCFTKSVEIIRKHTEHNGPEGCSFNGKRETKNPAIRTSGFKVENLGKVLELAWAQEEDGCYEELYRDEVDEDSRGGSHVLKPETAEEQQPEPFVARKLDLNVVSVPDLNADITTLTEGSPDEENGCSSEKNELARSNGSGDSQTCVVRPVGEVHAVESQLESRKRSGDALEETCDRESTLVAGSPLRFSNGFEQLDDNYEYCVKVIRWLECTGHIEKDFRMKFLTWLGLRSTEQERRVVITFIRTLVDEPNSLAGQLLDSFSEIVTCKRLRNGFCSKLKH